MGVANAAPTFFIKIITKTNKALHLRMEQAYIIARLKDITIPELLDALAEANAGKPVDIYEHLPPLLIDQVTDALWEFTDAVKHIKE